MEYLNEDTLVVTAFLSESCDSCVYMDDVIREFAERNPNIPVFIVTDEDMMDQAEIDYLPTVVISDGDIEARIEGAVSYEDIEDIFRGL